MIAHILYIMLNLKWLIICFAAVFIATLYLVGGVGIVLQKHNVKYIILYTGGRWYSGVATGWGDINILSDYIFKYLPTYSFSIK